MCKTLQEYVKDHNNCDCSSRLAKHAVETGHLPVQIDWISQQYTQKKNCRGFLVKTLKPSLKIQEKSTPLKLSN